MVEPGLLGAQEFRWKEPQESVTRRSSDPQPGNFLLPNAPFSDSSPTHSFPSFRIPVPFLSSSPFLLNFNSCLLQRFHFTELSPLS